MKRWLAWRNKRYLRRISRPSVEGHWAWANIGILCGNCGWMMQSDAELTHKFYPIRRIVFCINSKCPHLGIRYEVEKDAALKLFRVTS